MVQTNTRTDETLELIRRDLTKTFESCDFRRLDFGNRFKALLLRIAIHGLVLVLHAEERSLENIDVPFLDEVREELQEESQHQQPDVHSVHIGIGRDDHFVITQLVQTVFDVQRRLQAVELFVLIYHLFGQSVAVQRLTAQREHRLRAYIAALGNTTGRRQTLGDENTTLQPQIVVGIFGALDRLRVIQVYLAVTQFRVVDQVLLCALASRFRHSGDCLTLFLAVLNFLQHNLHGLWRLVQIVVQLLLNEIIDEFIDTHAARRTHVFRTEFHFRLTLEYRFLYVNRDSSNYAVSDVC